jgi:hypothetical protein
MQMYGRDVSDLTTHEINKLFRQYDESHLWPVCNEFDATQRAIDRLNSEILPHMGGTGGIEYASMLDQEISNIVNSII